MQESSATTGIRANQSRLHSLVLKGGKLRIPDLDNDLPQVLRDANAAVEARQVRHAAGLLNAHCDAVLKMLEDDDSRTDIMFVLGMLYRQTGNMTEAKKWYQRVLEKEPHPLVYNELGHVCQCMGDLSEALQHHRQAVRMAPDIGEIRANLARVLMATGETQRGIDMFTEAVELDPTNAALHSNFLFYLHYSPHLEPAELFEEHKKWGRMHAPLSMAKTFHANAPDPDRRLRIGYISPYFCMTSQAYNFEPLLDGHDREGFEIYGYSNVRASSSVTERLESKFDNHRDICRLSDAEAAGLIESDGIDILVELAGHVSDNRLGVLAYKPAPVQVDYLGLNTTGMEAIDYRLTDAIVNQEGSERFYTEDLVFLPESHLGYRPQDSAPPIGPLPALNNGYVTFGSFNNSCKINQGMIELWAEVLRANPNSRFLLKFGGGADRTMRENYFAQFEGLGIGRGRIAVYGYRPVPEHLLLYGQVDIALDAYPFNGCISTLEGLWMGVPVISLVGECFASRSGLHILTQLDMEFFATSTRRDYAARATALAQNLNALAKIRASMRERIFESPLCDGKGLARRIEAAYRGMWRKWCKSQRQDGS
ncbi:MAG: O-linked N-acetylglucosamine transferase, SPINDLY family protein [Planctomycetota bacterium]|jgi:predicted O-linked N-acetylglucosamine transferase (SPINDLY family)